MSEPREILFRGKRFDNGEWVDGILHVFTEKVAQIGGYIDYGTHVCIGNSYGVTPSTVGQYTGLLDKNGKLIFEGDIIELNHPVYFKKSVIGLVAYGRYTDVDSLDNYDYLGWYIKVRGKCVSILQPCVDGIEIQVIGNIHDNPELLEEEPADAT